jgi:acetyltransferase-like isoleucine patch superfamily enzyme
MSIYNKISAVDVTAGANCHIGERVTFTGLNGNPAQKVVLGDNCRIDDDCRIYVDRIEVGDNFTLNNHCLLGAVEPVNIGHSVWVGQNTILNGTDNLTIGNGVGIGAYSQLWTHIRHGDTVQGCRWDSTGPLNIGDDVWLVGHVIVSPINAAPRSMALVGSVVTKDMEENHVYGGSPAKDITDKVGPQFEDISIDEKMNRAQNLLNKFHNSFVHHERGCIRLVEHVSDFGSENISWFAVLDRKYKKIRSEAEFDFIKFSYPSKFFPL